MLTIDAVRILLFPSLMAFAASSDLLTMTISNRVSLFLAAGFCGLAIASGMEPSEIGFHALAGISVLVVSFIFYTRGWIGGGDAKLAAVTALWFGFDHLYEYVLCASIFGGVLTLLILKFREYPLPPFMSRHAWVVRLHGEDTGVPYGIALAVAALLIYPYTVWMQIAGI